MKSLILLAFLALNLLLLPLVIGIPSSGARPGLVPSPGSWSSPNAASQEPWLYLPLVFHHNSRLQASFTAAPATGIAPLAVTFTNTSTGAYTTSLWRFGDQVTSTLENPTHIYTQCPAGATPGTYTVTLTISGTDGSDTLTRPSYVSVCEARGLWVTRFEWTSSLNPGTPATIDEIVNQAAAANFDLLLFQVRGTADALYTPGLEPWSARLNGDGELGRDPGWDPLAYTIDRAHAAGLQVHAYVNVYPAWSGESAPLSTTTPVHPFWTWSWWPGTDWADWRQWDQSGPMLLNPNYLWASPGAPPVADHVVAVVMDILTRYDVDGLHLDYVRYAGPQYSCDPFSHTRFGGTCFDPGWEDWQRAQVTDLVRRIYQAKPADVLLSAAVWPVYVDRWGWGVKEGRNDYYQDSQGWVAAGVIDALVPMIYPGSYAADLWAQERSAIAFPETWTQDRFETLVGDFQSHAAGRGIIVGLSGGYDDFAELAARIETARAAGTAGYAIFSHSALEERGYWDDLVAPGGPHATPACPGP